jgi:hypothetical protein
VQINDVRSHGAHDPAQARHRVPEQVRMLAPVDTDNVHRDIGVGARSHELPAFTPGRRTDNVHIVAVALAQKPLALPVLVDDGAVVDPEHANGRQRTRLTFGSRR